MSVTAAPAPYPRSLDARVWGAVVAGWAVVTGCLAIREESEVAAQLGSVYDDYARRTPRFLPHLHAPASPLAGSR